jgi:hypothetical protein
MPTIKVCGYGTELDSSIKVQSEFLARVVLLEPVVLAVQQVLLAPLELLELQGLQDLLELAVSLAQQELLVPQV